MSDAGVRQLNRELGTYPRRCAGDPDCLALERRDSAGGEDASASSAIATPTPTVVVAVAALVDAAVASAEAGDAASRGGDVDVIEEEEGVGI